MASIKESKYNASGTIIAKATLFKKSDNKFKSTNSTLKKNDKVTITKKSSNGYYYVAKGPKGNVGLWIKKSTVKLSKTKEQSKSNQKNHIEEQYKADKASIDSYKSMSKKLSNSKDNLELDKLLVTSLQCVHGVPYQFMHTADNPLDNAIMFGRKYTERIIMRMPLLIMSPGEPDFLPNYSKKQKQGLAQKLLAGASGVKSSTINNLLSGKGGRYYAFNFKYSKYYKYVNNMLRYCAVCLGIGKVEHSIARTGDSSYFKRIKILSSVPKGASYTATLESFKWQKAITANPKWKAFFNSAEFVTFYLDSETSISDQLLVRSIVSEGGIQCWTPPFFPVPLGMRLIKSSIRVFFQYSSKDTCDPNSA